MARWHGGISVPDRIHRSDVIIGNELAQLDGIEELPEVQEVIIFSTTHLDF
ncbi:MAG: hypothetical protein ABI045_04620 [Flavobacteriales bacterium]